MNINLLGLAAAHDAFGEKDKRFGENVWNYYTMCGHRVIAVGSHNTHSTAARALLLGGSRMGDARWCDLLVWTFRKS
jgi:hypothetical protein